MPNPTTNWNWTIPNESADPWYEGLVDTFAQIDTTVHSIEISLVPRASVVLSVYAPAGAGLAIDSTTMLSMGATDGPWTVCSNAGYSGRYVGSFQLVTSGAQAYFALGLSGFSQQAGGSIGTGTVWTRWRLIVQRTGVPSLNIPSNSFWMFQVGQSNAHQYMAFQAVASLGPGRYSAELQANAKAFVGSSFLVNADDRLTLIVTETRLGS